MAEQPEVKSSNQVDTVLQDYLDQLLVAATAMPAPVEAPVVGTSMPVEEPAVRSQPIDTVKAFARSESVTQVQESLPQTLVMPVPSVAEVEQPHLPDTVTDTFETDQADDNPPEIESEHVNDLSVSAGGGTPVDTMTLNWRSSQGIDCLIFKVAGLKLAIPLPLLGGVFNVTDKVTPLFGQASWSLGVWQGEMGKLTIIDSAQLIMPERGLSLEDTGYGFFIQLDRSPWALACQEICDTVTLVHDSIKWRGETSKRPWLAGTVISEMCALIDVPGLMQLLTENVRPAAPH